MGNCEAYIIKAGLKICPRCGRSFECCAGNIENCACYGVRIPGKEIEEELSRYSDCLCVACLAELCKQNNSAADA